MVRHMRLSASAASGTSVAAEPVDRRVARVRRIVLKLWPRSRDVNPRRVDAHRIEGLARKIEDAAAPRAPVAVEGPGNAAHPPNEDVRFEGPVAADHLEHFIVVGIKSVI